MVFLAITEPKGDRNLLLSVKNNIGPRADGIAYKIASREIGDGIQTSCIEWNGDAVTMTADEALGASREAARKPGAVDEAMNFLGNLLGFGPVKHDDVMRSAGEAGISKRTLERAKERIGVVAQKAGFDDGWTWELP